MTSTMTILLDPLFWLYRISKDRRQKNIPIREKMNLKRQNYSDSKVLGFKISEDMTKPESYYNFGFIHLHVNCKINSILKRSSGFLLSKPSVSDIMS